MAETPEPESASSLTPAPRRHTSPERPANPASHEALADFADRIKLLANQLDPTPPDQADDGPDRPVKRHMRFQRKGAPEGRRSDPPLPEAVRADPSSDDLVENGQAEPPSPDDATTHERAAKPLPARENGPLPVARRAPRKPKNTTIPLLILMACNLGMLVVGYWLGQPAVPAGGAADTNAKTTSPKGPVDPLATGASDQSLETADLALKTERTDVGAAAHLYEDAVKQHFDLPGAEYRLAVLAMQRGDRMDADMHLTRSTKAGDHVAPCHFLWATLAGREGNFAEASRQLDAAVRAEPFNAKYCFCRGEALRRTGKPQAAATCLEQALARGYSPEEGDLYFFKLGLAQIEFGHNAEFSATIASHLLKQPVSGDWLLLAAAQDLERNDFAGAAGHLRAASQTMPAALFASRVRDFLFQEYAGVPLVAPLLNQPPAVESSEAGPSLMDPESWSPEKSDPGAWPIIGASGPKPDSVH